MLLTKLLQCLIQIWEYLLRKSTNSQLAPPLSLFMAVPTIYSNLLRVLGEERSESGSLWGLTESEVRQRCQELRLMVCGSAALPVPTMQQWRDVTGHVLLERYGMTEIGMALTNPYEGERKAGVTSRQIKLPYSVTYASLVKPN